MSYYSAFNIEQEAQFELEKLQMKRFWRRFLRLGRKMSLCSFSNAYEEFEGRHRVDRGIQQIPVDAIVGSINENPLFDDQFNPH